MTVTRTLLFAAASLSLGWLQGATAQAGAASDVLPEGIFGQSWLFAENGYESDRLRVKLVFQGGDQRVKVARCERPTAAEAWTCDRSEVTTPFFITSMASLKGGETVYVAGVDPDGLTVMERWDFRLRQGGWRLQTDHYYPVFTLAGQSVPSAALELVVKGGGEWSAPDPDAPARGPQRTRIDGLADVGALSSLVADPQGRYLLAYDFEAREVLQLELEASGQLSEVTPRFALADNGNMSVVESIGLGDLPGHGRVALINGRLSTEVYGEYASFYVALDPLNTGEFVFEEPAQQFVSFDAFLASPFGDFSEYDFFWGQ